jgi:hypothetical protein
MFYNEPIMPLRTPHEAEPTQTQHNVDPSRPNVRSRVVRRLGALAAAGLVVVGAGAFLKSSIGHEVLSEAADAGRATADAIAETPKNTVELPGDIVHGFSELPDVVDGMHDYLTGQDGPQFERPEPQPYPTANDQMQQGDTGGADIDPEDLMA